LPPSFSAPRVFRARKCPRPAWTSFPHYPSGKDVIATRGVFPLVLLSAGLGGFVFPSAVPPGAPRPPFSSYSGPWLAANFFSTESKGKAIPFFFFFVTRPFSARDKTFSLLSPLPKVRALSGLSFFWKPSRFWFPAKSFDLRPSFSCRDDSPPLSSNVARLEFGVRPPFFKVRAFPFPPLWLIPRGSAVPPQNPSSRAMRAKGSKSGVSPFLFPFHATSP